MGADLTSFNHSENSENENGLRSIKSNYFFIFCNEMLIDLKRQRAMGQDGNRRAMALTSGAG